MKDEISHETEHDAAQRPPALAAVTAMALEQPPEAFPEETRAQAALLLLDTLGIAAAAAPMEAGRIARNTACRLMGAGQTQDAAPLLFDGRRASVAGAAYAAASQIDNLDGHDGYNPAKGHVGCAVVPALLALAERNPALDGREALAALVMAYEVASRAGVALHATVPDYHTSGAWNALGVAALAARLRAQNPGQLRETLGIAEYHGPRSQMMREIATPTMLHDGSGWGALAGLSAAILAEEGFTGAPAVTIEAPEAAPFWADLEESWLIQAQYVKPFPTCRWSHAPMEGAARLRAAHDLDPSRIARVHIRSFANAVALYAGMPDTTSQAQYSLPFAVAAMLVHGQVGLSQISGAGLTDPRVARLVACTTTEIAAEHEARFPADRRADLILTLQDGARVEALDIGTRGGPDAPFSREEVVAKFMAFASPAIGESRAVAIRDATLALDRPGQKVSALTQHLYAPP
ncbi:MAG: MmgE/PrpD family protein [Pseudomonadota bacterium]